LLFISWEVSVDPTGRLLENRGVIRVIRSAPDLIKDAASALFKKRALRHEQTKHTYPRRYGSVTSYTTITMTMALARGNDGDVECSG
jgi:hypothetical protein